MPRRTIFVSYHTRAGNGTRTRDPNLGKVVLYQLSYSRIGPDPVAQTSPMKADTRTAGGPTDDQLHRREVEARGIEPLTS